ncbi:MAG: DUF488 domain-containing protein [Actinobacteria bacterium]|nr:DUF488 domain-containing protein [Actinomycetota bacterium]
MGTLKLKRVYEPRDVTDGYRVLVDRLWPRGVSKAEAGIDEWDKDVAPSTALRTWFGHDPAKFAEFTQRYRAELDGSPALTALRSTCAQHDVVTLLYAARDVEHNEAVVLQDLLG